MGSNIKPHFFSDCAGGIATYGGNAKGACCHFPFTYKGKQYNTSCATEGHTEEWCYTDAAETKWGNCIIGMICLNDLFKELYH